MGSCDDHVMLCRKPSRREAALTVSEYNLDVGVLSWQLVMLLR